MTDNPFNDRQISGILVETYAIYPATKRPTVALDVIVEMTRENGEPGGPQVRVNVGVEAPDDMSMREMPIAAFERALFLLKRLASETPESLRQIWIETADRANESVQLTAGQSRSTSVGGVTITTKVE